LRLGKHVGSLRIHEGTALATPVLGGKTLGEGTLNRGGERTHLFPQTGKEKKKIHERALSEKKEGKKPVRKEAHVVTEKAHPNTR